MNGMADDFLELARLESGRARFVKEPVHLGGLIGECVEIVRPQAEEVQIPIETDIDPSVSTVPGDRNRLKQVILNLLTNAIKYNSPRARCESSCDEKLTKCWRQSPTRARGSRRIACSHIFERFYRVPDQESRVGGTGLGLAISKRITEAHQGTISVDSQLGKGTTFTIALPVGEGVAYDTRPRA